MPRYNSKFFDAAYYINANKDVAANWVGDVQEHFFNYGAKEGRLPSSWFDFQYIRANNADLAGMTNEQLFQHYNTFGANEGRITAAAYANFDAAKYLSTYADLGAAGITAAKALSHYLAFGASEGRAAVNKDGTAISGNGTSSSGSTFTLTSATNMGSAFTGGNGNDTFVGDMVNEGGVAGVQTLNANDSLDGGAGTDTLTATIKFDVTPASLANIEVINVSNVDDGAAGSADLTLTNAGAVTTIKSSGNAEAIVFAGLSTKLTGGLELTNNAQNVTVTTAAAALSGSADDLAVTLRSVTAGTLSVDTATGTNGYESVTINSTGTVANTLAALNDGAATSFATLNVKGEKDLTITGTLDAEVKTVNASAFAGKLKVTQTNASVSTITGGTGDDTFVLNGTFIGAENATVANRDTINGGTGRDTLTFTSAEGKAASAATQSTVSNVEIIRVSDAGADADNINLTKFAGADTLAFDSTVGASTFTFNAGSTVDFAVNAGNKARTFTVDGTGTSDALTIKTVAGVSLGTSQQDFTGVEVLNINTGTVAGATVTIGGLIVFTPSAGGTSKIVATGVNALTFGNNETVGEIDASGLTGNATLQMGTTTVQNVVKITGTAKNDVIRGSAGNDVVITGAGDDTVTALGGNDSIDVSGGGSDTIVLATAGNDTVTGFAVGAVASGGDVLNVAGIITTPGTLTTPASLTGAATVANNSIQIIKLSGVAIANKDYAGADFGDLVGGGKVFAAAIADAAKAIFVVQGSDTTKVYSVTEATANDAGNVIEAGDLVLVATLTGVTTSNDLLIANFA